MNGGQHKLMQVCNKDDLLATASRTVCCTCIHGHYGHNVYHKYMASIAHDWHFFCLRWDLPSLPM
jgi:hypothetical protein